MYNNNFDIKLSKVAMAEDMEADMEVAMEVTEVVTVRTLSLSTKIFLKVN